MDRSLGECGLSSAMLPGLRSMHPHSDSIAGHGPPDEPAPSLSAETEAGVEPVAEALGILEGKRHQGSGYVSAHALDDDPDLLRHGGLSKKAERQLRQLPAAFRKDPQLPATGRPPPDQTRHEALARMAGGGPRSYRRRARLPLPGHSNQPLQARAPRPSVSKAAIIWGALFGGL